MKHHHQSLFFFKPPAPVMSPRCAAVGTHMESKFVSFQPSWDLTVRHYQSTKLLLRCRIGFTKNVTLFCWTDGCYWSSRCHLSGQTAATKLASVSTTWSLISSDVTQKQEQSKEWSCCRVHWWVTQTWKVLSCCSQLLTVYSFVFMMVKVTVMFWLIS